MRPTDNQNQPATQSRWGRVHAFNDVCDIIQTQFFETDQAPANKWTLSNEKLSNYDYLTGLGFDPLIVYEMMGAGTHKNWLLCTPQETRRQANYHAGKLAICGSYDDPEKLSLHDVDALGEPLPVPDSLVERILLAIDAAANADAAAATFIANHATQSPPPPPSVKGGILHACLTPKLLVSPAANSAHLV